MFNVAHPSSSLLIAVLDHDPEDSPFQIVSRAAASSLHDPIGRLNINLSNFQPDTVYTVAVSHRKYAIILTSIHGLTLHVS